MSKVAIVFWSATGNTETMANCIAEGAGAAATIVPCADMTPAKLGEFDVVAFGCPAMGAEQLEESEFEPMFTACEGRLSVRRAGGLSERQESRSVWLLRLGRWPVDARLVRACEGGRRCPVQRGGPHLQRDSR